MTQLLSESYQSEVLTFMETITAPGGICFFILMMSCPKVHSHLYAVGSNKTGLHEAVTNNGDAKTSSACARFTRHTIVMGPNNMPVKTF